MFEKVIDRAAVHAQERSLKALCAAFDPDSIPLSDVAAVSSSLARMAKLADGARTLLARRVAEAGEWKRRHRSAEEALAAERGSSLGAAKAALGTSRRLEGLGQTSDALRAGRLSAEQADAITDAAEADPSAEERLLGRAGRLSLPELREECRRTKAAADTDPEATYARVRAGRYLRRHTDAEGAYNLHLRTTADDGAAVDAALAPIVDRRFAEARAAGAAESPEAYAADALVEALTRTPGEGAKAGRGPESKVIALIDFEALRRGSTRGEERCELAGVGPVPVSTVQAMLTDAFLALVVTNGVDVYTVAHAGRQVTAHMRTALEARGYRCEVPGCGARHHLELDHLAGWALTRRTALDDLAWECRHHHHLKTHGGYRLEGPPTARRWLGPDGTVVAADHTPPPATGPPGSDPGEGTLFGETDAA